jgi:hypothetical protein
MFLYNDLRTSFVGSPVAKQPGAPEGRSWAFLPKSTDLLASQFCGGDEVDPTHSLWQPSDFASIALRSYRL